MSEPILGSPPRVRGKLNDVNPLNEYPRITPACAGKTYGGRPEQRKEQDHPRVCGENEYPIEIVETPVGSPPRVRGKHFGNGVFPLLILVLSLDPL